MMDFSWLNESELKREEEGKLVIFAPAGTDFSVSYTHLTLPTIRLV